MSLHLVTVGISLLTNYARIAELPLEKAMRRHKQLAEFLKAEPKENAIGVAGEK